jgi:hypothetical protein
MTNRIKEHLEPSSAEIDAVARAGRAAAAVALGFGVAIVEIAPVSHPNVSAIEKARLDLAVAIAAAVNIRLAANDNDRVVGPVPLSRGDSAEAMRALQTITGDGESAEAAIGIAVDSAIGALQPRAREVERLANAFAEHRATDIALILARLSSDRAGE